MAGVVRRLGFLTPETVANRRASCDPLSLSTRCLEVKPEFSEKRRASIGTFDALLPYKSRGKSSEKRASLCVPNYDNGPPSVAYLSRKRASLDNIFLTEWIQPGVSKSFQDGNINKTSICSTPKHLSKDLTQSGLAVGHLHESSTFQEHLHHRSCSRTPSYGNGDIYSSKTSNSHRKGSSPYIVFPSLSPCIEAKSKSDHFAFESSQVHAKQLVCKGEIQEESARKNELAVDAKLISSIPKIYVDTVHSGDDCQEKDKENSKTSSNFLADTSCNNPSYSPTCMQCCRRRFSLEVQPNSLSKNVNLGSFASRPLTPQSVQLHGNSFHHHRRLGGSELYSSNNTFYNNVLKRTATLSYSNLILKPVGSVINRGGFGVVKLGHFKGKRVAVKVLKGKRQAQSALREALLLKIQPQAHVNSTLAVITSSTSKDFANISWSKIGETSEEEVLPLKLVSSLFGVPMQDVSFPHQEDHDCNGAIEWAWVVSELCTPYTLLTLIHEPNIMLTARDKVRFIGEIANGLSYLHSQNLVHLDVKPANVLLAHTGHVKLADFGCCLELYGERNEHVLGTINYQAPEVLRRKEITDRSDVFALGVTAWHLLTQVVPFQGIHPHVIIYKVTKLLHRPVDHFPVHVSSYTLLEQLLNSIAVRCWAEDPKQRPSASVVSANLAALYLSPAT
ncbi:uncharacterized protein [Palaemon carinicauda]|uniref:uncharacterized protein isoform X2 n=1 Tax=Palaemon carinicauda TaxID=392227 RepID=UPI0035B5D793